MNLLSDYFTREQLADELGITTRTIERWESLRIGPPVTKVGKKRYYRKSSTQEWLMQLEQAKPNRKKDRGAP